MIALLVLIVAALVAGGALAALMLRDPGYVLVSYGAATLETSVWFALGALLALWLALATALALTRRLVRSGPALSGWLRGWRTTRAVSRSLRGWMLFAEERWQEAGKALLAAAPLAQTPLVDYVGAARAASARGDDEERDAALRLAREAQPEAAFVVELVRSELQQATGQWRESVATLTELQRQAARHPVVLARLLAAHRALGDWPAAAELAPLLGDEAAPERAGAEAAAWRARLAAPADAGADAVDRARDVWRAMPKRLRQDEDLLLAYVDALAEHGAAGEAESVLRGGLENQWRDAWVRRYGLLPSASDDADAAKRLRTATQWLGEHRDDATLLLTLGRLALATGDKPTARRHLDESLRVRTDPEPLEALGRLCAQEGDATGAADCFERALRAAREPAGASDRASS